MTAVEDALAAMGSMGVSEESRSASRSVSATLEKSIPDPAKHQRSVSTPPRSTNQLLLCSSPATQSVLECVGTKSIGATCTPCPLRRVVANYLVLGRAV